MTDELKPVRCGCGGEAKVCRGTTNPPYFWVECEGCHASTMGAMKLTEAEAITAWNRAMGERTAKVEGHRCTACDNHIGPCMKYCPNCGARLEREQEDE